MVHILSAASPRVPPIDAPGAPSSLPSSPVLSTSYRLGPRRTPRFLPPDIEQATTDWWLTCSSTSSSTFSSLDLKLNQCWLPLICCIARRHARSAPCAIWSSSIDRHHQPPPTRSARSLDHHHWADKGTVRDGHGNPKRVSAQCNKDSMMVAALTGEALG